MTDTLQRPVPRAGLPRPVRPAAPRRHPLAGGLTAALWAALVGIVSLAVPVLVVWAADSRSGSGAGDAVRAAGHLWLLAHSTTLTVTGGSVGLTPLGLAAVPFLLLARAGAHAARECGTRTWRELGALAVAVAAPYSVVAAVVASLSTTGAVAPAPVQALLGSLLVAALGTAVGATRAAGLRLRLSPVQRGVAHGAGSALAVLLGSGAVLVALSMLLHLDRAAELARASAPGAVGGIALLLLGLALVPNAVVFGASWVAGPGFAVGTGTVVSPWSHDLGAVPALPLLAALPSGPAPALLAVVTLVVPLLAGVLAGRCTPVDRGPLVAARHAAVTGPLAGAAMALLCLLAGGPLGGARLAEVGPTAWLVGLVVAVQVGAVAAVTAAARARR